MSDNEGSRGEEGEEFIRPFNSFSALLNESETFAESSSDDDLLQKAPPNPTVKFAVKKKKKTSKTVRLPSSNDCVDFPDIPPVHSKAAPLEEQENGDFASFVDRAWLDPAAELRSKFTKAATRKHDPNAAKDDRRIWLLPMNFYQKSLSRGRPFSTESIGLHLMPVDARTFALHEDPEYTEAREELEEAMRGQDISRIYSDILHPDRHPNHPDALLCLAQAACLHPAVLPSGLTPMDMVQRCIFVLQRTLSSNHTFAFGNCRLPYAAFAENRRIHLALFVYAQLLLRQACWQTARNVAVVLWSLDGLEEGDPLGAKHLLALASIQAGRFLGQDERLYNRGASHALFNRALALHLSESTEAGVALARGIREYPGIALGIHSILSSPSSPPANKDPDILTHVYCNRMAPLWRQPRVSSWFTRTYHASLVGSFQAKTSNVTAKERLALYRHHLLSVGVESGWRGCPMPPDISAMPLHSHDPLPPEFAEDSREPFSLVEGLVRHFSQTLYRFLP